MCSTIANGTICAVTRDKLRKVFGSKPFSNKEARRIMRLNGGCLKEKGIIRT